MNFPIINAVKGTFAFFIANFSQIVRIVWLPAAILFAGLIAIMPSYMQAMVDFQSNIVPGQDIPPELVEEYAGAIVGPGLLTLALNILSTIVIGTGLLKLVVRGETNGKPYYLAFGPDEARIFGTMAMYILVLIGVLIGAGVIMGLSNGLSRLGPGPGGALQFVAVIAAFVLGIWIQVRLSLSLPAAIEEKKIGIEPSWRRTEGQFWSIFAFWLTLAIALAITMIPINFLLTPAEARTPVTMESTPEERQAIFDAMKAMFDFSNPANILRYFLSYVVNTLVLAFFLTATGVAWRYLTDPGLNGNDN